MQGLTVIRTVWLMLVMVISWPAVAGDFLPPDQAFALTVQDSKLHWQIADGYYLYRDRIHVVYQAGDRQQEVPLVFHSQSQLKQDKNFGEVAVFYQQLQASLDLASLAGELPASLQLEYQGCSANGLCYQPQIHDIPLAADMNAQTLPVAEDKPLMQDLQSTEGISRFLADAGLLTTVLVFLLLGIGLSLTPCILPMVPILSGIIVGQGEQLTVRRGLLLSSSYVLGMAVSYAAAGVLAATFGASGNLQMAMQNRWVLLCFALVFVALSLSMFGLYTLALPSRLQNALHRLSGRQQGGHDVSVLVMGALSALVVSPCVSAPLAGALVFISSTGDKLVGASALFMLAIGMGLPLIAIGAGGGKLVPRAGA
ncbi:MAG TPA: protein-disulfide reductase DsbD, partial [Pseudomonadales bacterium]